MNYETTIFIPVSRPDYLDRLFVALEHLDCDTNQTNLLTYVDGDAQLFLQTRNLTDASRFASRLCVQRRPTGTSKVGQVFGLMDRRKRIADIKNESKALIGACDYVFGLEDDTIPPPNALAKLQADYLAYPHAGFIEGVELGRWGIAYVGAWSADDPYDPTKIESLLPPAPDSYKIQEIDAGGFYCYLTPRANYMMQEYKPFGRNDLGPDVNFGLFLRQQGFKNYIDWSINCEHRMRGGGSVSLPSTPVRQAAMVKENDQWKQVIARIE